MAAHSPLADVRPSTSVSQPPSAADIAVQHIAKELGGADKLKGKKISLVYHDSPYGKEPIPALEALAAKLGFTYKGIPVTHPGVEQKSQWLAVRQDRPDYQRNDGPGFIRVDRELRSLSHRNVFAAGDVAAYADARPKSGVYAVRAGPALSRNLRAFCEDRPLQPWTPQRRALYLISTGARHALGTWGAWSWSGRWVWRWKDRIDRAFMRRFGAPEER